MLAVTLAGGCGSGGLGRDPVSAVPPPSCERQDVRYSASIETLEELVARSDTVVRATIGEVELREVDPAAPDEAAAHRVVLHLRTRQVLAGAPLPPDGRVFAATQHTGNDGSTSWVGIEHHRFSAGEDVVLGLTEPPDGSDEHGLLTPDAYFVLTDGRIDPAVAERRIRCAAGGGEPLDLETRTWTSEQLVERIGQLGRP